MYQQQQHTMNKRVTIFRILPDISPSVSLYSHVIISHIPSPKPAEIAWPNVSRLRYTKSTCAALANRINITATGQSRAPQIQYLLAGIFAALLLCQPISVLQYGRIGE